jgi:hypothetical protein
MRNSFISILLCGLVAAGCTLDKDYLNGPNAASFPSSKSEVEAGVFSVYKSFTDLQNSGTPFTGLQDNGTDIGSGRINRAEYMYQQVCDKMQPNNIWVEKVYQWMYKTVARVNLVLDNIDKVKGDMTETEYNQYKAELLCQRAYLYDWGCQLWGDIPYIDHTLSLSDSYGRTPKAEVIANVLKSLDDNILEALPERWNKNDYGFMRIGRATAFALKARINLNWAGDNTVPEATYENAKKYATKAIELAEGAGYKLASVDISPCGKDHTFGEPDPTPIFGITAARAGDEWLWGLEYSNAIDGNTHTSGYDVSPRHIGGCAMFSPNQALIDAFQCTDGLSITESPLYDWKNPWKNRDPRLDLYCARSDTRTLGVEYTILRSKKKVHDYNTNQDITNTEVTGNKNEYGSNGSKGASGYAWRKYMDPEDFAASNYKWNSRSKCVKSYPLMRLPELYLIRAEADIELGIDFDQARADIKKIRDRVGMPEVKATDQAALRSALRYERMVELCDEGFRWFDIRRWGIASKCLQGDLVAPNKEGYLSNAKPVIDADWHCDYSQKTTWDGSEFNLRTYTKFVYNPSRDAVWPIPETEMIANPNMKQNAGYGAE